MDKIQPISFIIPSRTNLKYLKNAYKSIRENLDPIHEICMADDASTDGTWDWMLEIQKKDDRVKIHRNEGPERRGHTILYDVLALEYATNDIMCIFHADMWAAKGMDVAMLKHLAPKVMVSATRIEPPLHFEEPLKKIIKDYGIEPNEFVTSDFDAYVEQLKVEHKGKTTESVFAPWICYISDFRDIGGHDPLFAPQSKEDDDCWNRFMLNGGKFIQTWEGYVYHLTCRGSRFADGAKRNPNGDVFMKDRETDEWLIQNMKSTRNFIRKYGVMVKQNEYGRPIISPKYNIGFNVKNCDMDLLKAIEPWCSVIHTDLPPLSIQKYIKEEQPNTLYDLNKRVFAYDLNTFTPTDILVAFDANDLNGDNINILSMLPDIIQDSGEIGQFELDIFTITINAMTRYENELIKVDKIGGLR